MAKFKKTFSKNYFLENSTNLGWGENSAVLDKERAELLKKYLIGKRILDVGCGLGVYVDYICSLGLKGFGVDLVDEFIKKNKVNKKGEFIKGAAEKLPFEDDFFNTVILFDILEHGDDLKILEEAKRVSKKRIILIVPREVDTKLSNSGVIFRHYLDKTHLREYKEKDFKKLADQNRLNLIHIQPVHKIVNKLVFIALYKGPVLLRDIIRKLVDFILPREEYYSEYFVVLEKR